MRSLVAWWNSLIAALMTLAIGAIAGGCRHALPSRSEPCSAGLTIEASYSPGFVGKAWKILVWMDGRVEAGLETDREFVGRWRRRLTPDELRALRALIDEVGLFELPEQVGPWGEDQQRFSIWVRIAGRQREMHVWNPELYPCAEEVRAFLSVWNGILELVPPPGACDTPTCRISCQ